MSLAAIPLPVPKAPVAVLTKVRGKSVKELTGNETACYVNSCFIQEKHVIHDLRESLLR